VADTNNGTVRRIDTATGTVHTIVGLFTRTLQDTLGYLPAAVVAQGIAVDHAHGLVYLSTNDAILSFPF
jgi:DNA-binding beta-propeller fold protein YncE